MHRIIARGDKVIATGRNTPSRLHHLEETGAHILDLDVTLSQRELNEKINVAIGVYGGIDILVNNAGYIESSFLEELRCGHLVFGSVECSQLTLRSPERLQANFDTNFFGAVNLTRAILPHFRSKRSGTLVYIGSQAGWRGAACVGSYCSTKFALEGRYHPSLEVGEIKLNIGMVESMNKEISGFGIRSIIFELGFYRTQAFSNQNFRFSNPTISAYTEFNEKIQNFVRTTHNKQPGDPTKAVERMIDVLKGEGMASGKGGELPLRLPLGTDGLAAVREKCLATLKICDEWEKISISTDVD